MAISTRAHTYLDNKYLRGYYKSNESEVISVGWKIGAPSLKLNNVGTRSKHCGDFGGVAREALEERQGRDPDIDKERSHLNHIEGYRTAAELQEYSRRHVEQLKDAKGRKLRKDAVVMCSTILKPPAAYMATLTPDQQRQFLNDANEAFAEIVGRDNVKSRADHFDELGAHSHVFWEPMTADGRLCAKEVHNLQFFGRVNRELPQKLRDKGWDIEDCEMYDAAKEEYEKSQKQGGRSSMAFKAEAEKAKQALEAEIAGLERKAASARQQAVEATKKASDATREAQEAEAKAEALKAAVRPPEALQAVTVKKAMFGGVKLSNEGFEVYRQTAEGGALAKAAANYMNEHWEQMERDAEEARREAAELREREFDRNLKLFDLQARVQALEKEVRTLQYDNKRLREQLDKMNQVARGESGILSRLAQVLPGALGDAAFMAAMTKATGRRFESKADFMEYWNSTRNEVARYTAATEQLLDVRKQIRTVSLSK